MRLFDELDIETQAYCNRRCPTCLRNAYPDKTATAGYFGPRQLPAATVYSILDQAAALGFHGAVVLSVYNEPLLDPRIADFARYAHNLHTFAEVFMCSNGDFLTPELAAELDGYLDNIRLALYDDHKRAAYLHGLFRKTHVTFTGGRHIPRHYNCSPDMIAAAREEPCEQEAQMRCPIASDGTLRLCCEDIAGHWQLGSIFKHSLRELWFGEPHATIVRQLRQVGGRQGYCRSCPQRNVPYWSVGAQMLTSGDF